MPRLTPTDLARFRADYHECRVTIMPLVLECEALTRERDESREECARAWAVLRECGADDVAPHDRDLADAVRRVAGHFARLCREESERLSHERDLAVRAARAEQAITDAAIERARRLEAERDGARAECDRFAAQSRATAEARLAPAPHADALRLLADAALAAGERSVTAEVDALARVVDDLRASRREAAGLAAELARLRDAVGAFLAADGHDLCHENRRELAAAAGLEAGSPGLPPEAEFALRCVEYRQELYGPDGPGSETEAWQAEVARLQDIVNGLAARVCAQSELLSERAEKAAEGGG